MSTLCDEDWMEFETPLYQKYMSDVVYYHSIEHGMNYIIMLKGTNSYRDELQGQIYDISNKKYIELPLYPKDVHIYFGGEKGVIHTKTNKMYILNHGSSDSGAFVIYDIVKNEYDLSELAVSESFPKVYSPTALLLNHNDIHYIAHNEHHKYDINTKTFTKLHDSVYRKSIAYGHKVIDIDNKLYLFGGNPNSTVYKETIYTLDLRDTSDGAKWEKLKFKLPYKMHFNGGHAKLIHAFKYLVVLIVTNRLNEHKIWYFDFKNFRDNYVNYKEPEKKYLNKWMTNHLKKDSKQFFPENSAYSVITNDFMIHFLCPWPFEEDKRYNKAVHLSKLIGIDVFEKYMKPIIGRYIEEIRNNEDEQIPESIVDLIFKYSI